MCRIPHYPVGNLCRINAFFNIVSSAIYFFNETKQSRRLTTIATLLLKSACECSYSMTDTRFIHWTIHEFVRIIWLRSEEITNELWSLNSRRWWKLADGGNSKNRKWKIAGLRRCAPRNFRDCKCQKDATIPWDCHFFRTFYMYTKCRRRKCKKKAAT